MTVNTKTSEFLKEKNVLIIGRDEKTNSKVIGSVSSYIDKVDTVNKIASNTNLSVYDLIIADIDNVDTKELFKVLSNDFYNTPVIFLTSNIKNINFNYLYNISIKNILLKESMFLDNIFIYIYIILQKSDKIIFKDGYYYSLNKNRFYNRSNEVPLTKLELKLFQYLVKNTNKVVTYDDLRKNVWLNNNCTIFSMRNVINKIREKSYYEIISNISKKGYSVNNELVYL